MFRKHYVLPNLKMEAVPFSEIFLSAYKLTRRDNTEDQYRHIHSRENIGSRNLRTSLLSLLRFVLCEHQLSMSFLISVCRVSQFKTLYLINYIFNCTIRFSSPSTISEEHFKGPSTTVSSFATIGPELH
jgi:hypothetical protein